MHPIAAATWLVLAALATEENHREWDPMLPIARSILPNAWLVFTALAAGVKHPRFESKGVTSAKPSPEWQQG